ncbi:MAG: hypothetical protein ACP5FH_06415 [Terracidiphilus sp.]
MIQSIPMKAARAIPFLLLGLTLPAAARRHVSPPVQPATSYAAVEIHAREKVAVAAEPYDTPAKESFFRVDYLAHGVLPIRLIVTNSGSLPVRFDNAQFFFVTAAGDALPAATAEDVERRISLREREGAKVPMPFPFPGLRLKPKASDQEVEQDFATFAFRPLDVAPHTTRAGFLFYDLSGLDHPLHGASLRVRGLRSASGNPLFSFEIPFDRYLQSKSSQMN